MKKLLVLAFALILMLGLASCDFLKHVINNGKADGGEGDSNEDYGLEY